LSFSLLRSLPGDPAAGLAGQRASPEAIAQIRAAIGADKSLGAQYLGYLALLMQGNLGRSYYTNRDVLQDVLQKLPNTMRLALFAMCVAVPAGVVLGLAAAYQRRGPVVWVYEVISIGGVSVPVFWSGIMLMLLVSLTWKLLPPSGTGGMRFMILPALVLSLPALATLARVTRTAVLDVMAMLYVRTARAKGLSSLRVKVLHVLRNALVPIVTIIGLDFGSYLNGAVVTETIFGWDGIGRFTMEGIITRDYPVILGCIITGTIVFVAVNLLTDVLYHLLDPRIRTHVKER
jgi:ABC-type dipeptide/oligopeptide/nickel transport system permease component